jgi:hypothetical protein
MPIHLLHRIVRAAFREMTKRGGLRLGLEESARILKAHRPEWMDVDIRKAVARMLAEEWLAQ